MKTKLLLASVVCLCTNLSAQITQLNVSADSTSICVGDTVNFTIQNSENFVDYYLRNASNGVVDGPIGGNGGTINFSTAPAASQSYHVYATSNASVTARLDGFNESIIAPVDNTFDYSQVFTYEAWVKIPAPGSGSYNPILFFGDASFSDVEIYIRSNDLYIVHNRDLPSSNYAGFPSPPDDTWFHFAYVWNGVFGTVYYDGVPQSPISSGGAPGIVKNSSTVEFGGIAYAGFPITQNYQKYADGMIDDIRIWDYARTANDITSFSSVCLNGNETGLVAYYDMNDGTGLTATDKAGSNDATLTNMENDDWALAGPSVPCSIQSDEYMLDTIAVTLNSINTSVMVVGNQITSLQSPATYQWIDCSTNAEVQDENGMSFDVTQSGDYAVALNVNGCIDTSNCETVNISSLDEFSLQVSLYPNPTFGQLTIESDEKVNTVNFYSLDGKLIKMMTNPESVISMEQLGVGVYVIEILSVNGGRFVSKVIKS